MSYKKNVKVTAVYSNYKNKDDTPRPPDKVEHVVRIEGDEEYYRLKQPSKPEFLKEGATVSFSVNTWTPKTGGMTRYYIKQIAPVMDDPLPNNDMPQSEKEWLNEPVENPTDFNPNKLDNELVPPHLKKEQQIFVTALLKSSIEGSFLNPFEREKVDKAILEFKDIYNINFK